MDEEVPENLSGYTVKELKQISLKWYSKKSVEDNLRNAEWKNDVGVLFGFACKVYITRDGKLHVNKPKINRSQ